MTTIDLSAPPADIFKAAAADCHTASLALEAAKARIADEQAAYDNANANLQWAALHPALASVDKNALYQEAVRGLEAPIVDGPVAGTIKADADAVTTGTIPAAPTAEEKPAEPAGEEKPKRKRRTKAEMEAARAAEAAKKAEAEGALASAAAEAGKPVEANEADHAAQQVEGQGLGAPAQQVDAGTPQGAPAAAFDPFGTNGAAPAPTLAPPVSPGPPPAAPPAAPGGADPFDPFGTGA